MMIETLNKKRECTGVAAGYMMLGFQPVKGEAKYLTLEVQPDSRGAQLRRVTLTKEETQNLVDYAIHCGLAKPKRGTAS
jgi:hypothetical protein